MRLGSATRRVAAVLTSLVTVCAGAVAIAPNESSAVTTTGYTIIAHRGGLAEFPQNSMTAFQASIDAGMDAIETDIQRTYDGVLVLAHDDKIRPGAPSPARRSTPCAGARCNRCAAPTWTG